MSRRLSAHPLCQPVLSAPRPRGLPREPHDSRPPQCRLAGNIAGVATIQAFGQEAKMYRRFQEINFRYRDVLLRSIRYNAVFFPVIELFSALTVGLLLWYGGSLVMADAIQAGGMVAFLQY